jgi:hypothetical protein
MEVDVGLLPQRADGRAESTLVFADLGKSTGISRMEATAGDGRRKGNFQSFG